MLDFAQQEGKTRVHILVSASSPAKGQRRPGAKGPTRAPGVGRRRSPVVATGGRRGRARALRSGREMFFFFSY